MKNFRDKILISFLSESCPILCYSPYSICTLGLALHGTGFEIFGKYSKLLCLANVSFGMLRCNYIYYMITQMTDLKLSVDLLEKERDFYFAKLRDIEIICQMPELENIPVRFPLWSHFLYLMFLS